MKLTDNIKDLITLDMIQRAFNGEVLQILPSPGDGYCWQINKDGTYLKLPVVQVEYD